MKRVVLLSLILLSSLFLTGCSYVYNFMIVNSSNRYLNIEFKWQKKLSSTPQKYEFKSFNGNKFEKLEIVDEITKEEIDSAEQSKVFHFNLKPKQALSIYSMVNGDVGNHVDELFRINFLSIKGENGEIVLSGNQVWFQFQEMEKGYFINYK